MPSEETDTRLPGVGNDCTGQRDPGSWRCHCSARWSDSEPTISLTSEMALGCGQTTEVGAYVNQRLNPTKLGRPMEEMPRFRTGPGKSGCPGLLGGPAKRSHGGIVNPSCNRKGKHGNPAPKAGARGLYPNRSARPRVLRCYREGHSEA